MLQTRVQGRPEDSRWRRNEAEATRWVSKGAEGENLAGESKNAPSLGNHSLADSKGGGYVRAADREERKLEMGDWRHLSW